MRTSVFLFVPFFAACNEAGVTKFNANPTAVITSHVDGDTVQEGEPELLTGQVGDADDGVSSLSVTWTVGGAEVCTDSVPDLDGTVSCETAFEEEGGTVILAVSDPAGSGASATVNLEVQATDAPVANLTEPTATGKYYAGQSIAFRGTVSDTEDDPEDLTVTIETDASGDLGLEIEVTSEGDVEAFGLLPEGEHAVRLRVVDTDGKEGIDSNIINVGPENSAPTCAITAPEDGASGPAGEDVRFEGTVNDVDVTASELLAAWASDIDGPLRETTPDTDGSVGFSTDALSINTHRITLTVTDELNEPCTTSIYYTVSNTAPEVDTVAVTPETGRVGDTLTCTATASDPDGDALTITYAWDDGTIGDTYTITETNNPGDVLTCTATATDTDGATGSSSATATVENTDPEIDSIAVTPDEGPIGATVTCTATASDADGESPSITYAWSDGSEGDSLTIPDSTSAGDSFTCTATATDEAGGTATAEATATVLNTTPVVSSVLITPDTGRVGDTLTCTATATDPDGGDIGITYSWGDGTTGDTYTITETNNPGDILTCTATATDADGAADSDSATATVENTDPVIDIIGVSPDAATSGTLLTCTATASDADGESPTITYEWDDGTTGDTFTIPVSAIAEDTFRCTATATDADGGSATATATTTVINNAPVMDLVTITPDTGHIGDTLTCTATATDEDGDALIYSYTWGDGSEGESYTIAADDAPGDTITCTATARDPSGGSDTGTASATVANREPVIVGVTVGPEPAYNDSTLTCAASATDADGDSPTITYEWTGGATGPELPLTSIFAAPFDVFTCTATATDAAGATTTGSASITLSNRDPVFDEIVILPENPTVSDTLTCSVEGLYEPDGDSIEIVNYVWTIGGSPTMVDTPTMPAGSARKGKLVACYPQIWDPWLGPDLGTATGMGYTYIVNSAPEVSEVTLTPSDVYTNDTVSAMATTSDVDVADADELIVTYAFTVNDEVVQDGEIASLSGVDHFDKGDTVFVAVTVDDGEETATRTSSALTVQNSPPTAPVVSIGSGESGAAVCDLLEWNGDDTYVMLDHDSTGIAGSSEITIESWIFPEDIGRQMNVFSQWASGSTGHAANVGFMVQYTSSKTLNVCIVGGSCPYYSSKPIPTDAWSHLALVFDNGTLDMYIDGERTDSWSTPYSVIGSGTDQTKIGAGQRADLHRWSGLIYDVRVWTTARSAADLAAHMLTPPSADEPHLTGHWLLNDGTGTTAADDSLREADGVVHDGDWSDECFNITDTGAKQWHESVGGNGHWYAVRSADSAITWTEAAEAAEDEGGHLVSLTTAEENDWVYNTLLTNPSVWDFGEGHARGPYIGLYESEGSFAWVTGEPTGYFSWVSGDPNGGAPDDIGAFYARPGAGPTWADEPFSGTDHEYVVEWTSIPNDDLVCTIDEESTDADGDPITYTFDWDVDGVEYTDTESTTHEGDTVPADALGSEEEWTCEVTPNDGDTDGDHAEATHTTERFCDDADGDGYSSCDEDCDDTDPLSSAIPFDADCDGIHDAGVGSGGFHQHCMLDSRGSIVCWGASHTFNTRAPDGTGYKMVRLTGQRACALDYEGRIKCWHAWYLGHPSTISGPGYTQVEVDNEYTCGLDAEGRIECWDLYDSPWAHISPLLLEIPSGTGYTNLAISNETGCASHSERGLECWGETDGLGTLEGDFYTDIVLTNSSAITGCGITVTHDHGGGDMVCAGTPIWSPGVPYYGSGGAPSGTYIDLGPTDGGHICGIRKEHSYVHCFGRDTLAEPSVSGRVLDTPAGAFSSFGHEWVSVSGGRYHSCALDSGGNIECWGDDAIEFAVP